MNQIIAYRIKNARQLRGYSLEELAQEADMPKNVLRKYEKGEAVPNSKELIKLSKALEQKIDYFFNSFKVEIGNFNFRKRTSFRKKSQNSIRAEITIHLENYIWIEELLEIDTHFENKVKDIVIDSKECIEQVVLKLRTDWEIGIDPIHNIIQLLEDKGIKVIELEDVDTKFDGLATFVNDSIPVIVINQNFSIERKRFTLLHELGHILLNLKECEDKQEEQFCNYFASEFLFPAKLVFREFGEKRKHISLEELKSIQEKYGISIQAIVYKLSELGIIDKEKHKSFHIQLNADKFLKEFVNQEVFSSPEKSNRFERLVYRALAQEEISISKAASLTGKSIEELKNISELI